MFEGAWQSLDVWSTIILKGTASLIFPLYAGPNWRYFFGFGIIWTYQKWVIKIIKNRVICFRKISLSMEKMQDV